MTTLLPNVSPEMLTPDFWINQLPNPQQTILTPEAIVALNHKIHYSLPEVIIDLADYPEEITKTRLARMLRNHPILPNSYDHAGQPIPVECFKQLWQKTNLKNIPNRVQPIYGVTIRRANLRFSPQSQPVYHTPHDTRFDLLQATTLDPGELLMILHQSQRSDWCYIQTGFYRGWVLVNDLVSFQSRRQWLDYLNHTPFSIVIDPYLKLQGLPESSEELFFEMGSKIPLKKASDFHHAPLIPTRTPDGSFQLCTVDLPYSRKLTVDYLPCTPANLLRQAFKMLGETYGWGGRDCRIDCSSFIRNIYRCFGIQLPRDSQDQADCGGTIIHLNQLSPEERNRALTALPVGALLYLNGHIMFYLGTAQGRPYVIHALATYGNTDASGRCQPVHVMQVVVSDLNLHRPSGIPLKMLVSKAIVIQ